MPDRGDVFEKTAPTLMGAVERMWKVALSLKGSLFSVKVSFAMSRDVRELVGTWRVLATRGCGWAQTPVPAGCFYPRVRVVTSGSELPMQVPAGTSTNSCTSLAMSHSRPDVFFSLTRHIS